jgi:hypothetical protein
VVTMRIFIVGMHLYGQALGSKKQLDQKRTNTWMRAIGAAPQYPRMCRDQFAQRSVKRRWIFLKSEPSFADRLYALQLGKVGGKTFAAPHTLTK